MDSGAASVTLKPLNLFGFEDSLKNPIIMIAPSTLVYVSGLFIAVEHSPTSRDIFLFSPEVQSILGFETPPNRRVITTTERRTDGALQISIYAPKTFTPLATIPFPEVHSYSRDFVDMSISPDSKTIAVQLGRPNWSLLLWRWSEHKLVASAHIQTAVRRILINPYDPLAILALSQNGVRVWRVAEGAIRLVLQSRIRRLSTDLEGAAWISELAIAVWTKLGDVLFLEGGGVSCCLSSNFLTKNILNGISRSRVTAVTASALGEIGIGTSDGVLLIVHCELKDGTVVARGGEGMPCNSLSESPCPLAKLHVKAIHTLPGEPEISKMSVIASGEILAVTSTNQCWIIPTKEAPPAKPDPALAPASVVQTERDLEPSTSRSSALSQTSHRSRASTHHAKEPTKAHAEKWTLPKEVLEKCSRDIGAFASIITGVSADDTKLSANWKFAIRGITEDTVPIPLNQITVGPGRLLIDDDFGQFCGMHARTPNGPIFGISPAESLPLLTSVCRDGWITVSNYITNEVIAQASLPHTPASVRMHPSGVFLVVTTRNSIRIMSINPPVIKTLAEISEKGSSCVAFAEDGGTFAISAGPVIRIYQFYTLRLLRVIRAHGSPVAYLTITPGSSNVISVGMDGKIFSHSIATGRCELTYRFTGGTISGGAIGHHTGPQPSLVKSHARSLVDAHEDQKPSSSPRFSASHRLALSPGSPRTSIAAALGCSDGVVRILDGNGINQAWAFETLVASPVTSVAFAAGPQALVARIEEQNDFDSFVEKHKDAALAEAPLPVILPTGPEVPELMIVGNKRGEIFFFEWRDGRRHPFAMQRVFSSAITAMAVTRGCILFAASEGGIVLTSCMRFSQPRRSRPRASRGATSHHAPISPSSSGVLSTSVATAANATFLPPFFFPPIVQSILDTISEAVARELSVSTLGLVARMQELKDQSEISLRRQAVIARDKIRKLRINAYKELERSKHDVETLRASLDRARESESRAVRIFQDRQSTSLSEAEAGFRERFLALSRELELVRQRTDDRRFSLEEEIAVLHKTHEEELRAAREKYTTTLGELDEEHQRLQAKLQECRQSAEAAQVRLQDTQFSQVENKRAKLQHKLSRSQAGTRYWKEQVGTLGSQFEQVNKLIEDLQGELGEKNLQISRLEEQISANERIAASLRGDIEQRDMMLKQREKIIADFNSKNTKLMRSRHVLEYKIAELMRKIAPRDSLIGDMREQITEMDQMVTRQAHRADVAELRQAEKKMKLKSVAHEVRRAATRLRLVERSREELALAVLHIVQDLDRAHWSRAVRRLYNYLIETQKNRDPSTATGFLEAVFQGELVKTEEVVRERDYLKRSLVSLSDVADKRHTHYQIRAEEALAQNKLLLTEANDLRVSKHILERKLERAREQISSLRDGRSVRPAAASAPPRTPTPLMLMQSRREEGYGTSLSRTQPSRAPQAPDPTSQRSVSNATLLKERQKILARMRTIEESSRRRVAPLLALNGSVTSSRETPNVASPARAATRASLGEELARISAFAGGTPLSSNRRARVTVSLVAPSAPPTPSSQG
eukprot:gnl/Chilomastix_cuspidata/2722.p1 GENE.gnl/Chilomastix_cuspidata/2722~~gnl/Chilomastix_cuspidata/2722.p1  ORF type:complete len:1555 (+),score=546.83 gnl/Chilomastix_cuspidata/2722:70-4734(+)